MSLRVSWKGLAATALLAVSCSRAPEPTKLTVAAASNLSGVLEQVTAAFQQETGTEVVISYGSTAQLAQQIENGAPFDLFAAADTGHVDALLKKSRIDSDSRAVYARGQLALWVPEAEKLGVHELKDLTRAEVRVISIAQPDLAPYGVAAVQALKSAGLWKALEPKVVYANNINTARQYAATGNANAAFTAYSLVSQETGVFKVDPKLYSPIDQALGVVVGSGQDENARKFAAFTLGAKGREILARSGYLLP